MNVQKVRSKSQTIARAIAGLGPITILIIGLSLPATAARSEQKEAEPVAEKVAEKAEEKQKTFPPTSTQMSHDVAEDLRRRREELETRVRALEAREAEIAAKERALEEELQKLETIRADISKIETGNQAANAEKIAKIVETLEAMSPKASSKVLAELDEPLAVQSLSQVSSGKLAKILSALEPTKSARFTELLAGVSRAKRSVASVAPAAKNPDQKGGENYERNSNQQQLPNVPTASQRK